MQTDNRFFDDLAKLVTGAAGAMDSVRAEMEASFRAWLDRRLGDLDLVRRDEFEAVKEMAAKAREENERLTERITALERKGTRPARTGGKAPAKRRQGGAGKSAARSGS